MKLSAEIRSRTFNDEFFGGQAPRTDVPTSVDFEIQPGIISTFRQIPAMDLAAASMDRKTPVSRQILLRCAALCCGVQREPAAHAIVLPSEESQDIRQRRIAPVQRDSRRLQSRRG